MEIHQHHHAAPQHQQPQHQQPQHQQHQHPQQQHPQQHQQQQHPQPQQHQHQQHQQQQHQQPHQQHQQQHQQSEMDYSTVKHLLSEAEMQQAQSQGYLDNASSVLLAAQSQHETAKLAFDETVAKVERLKSQFRTQIMDEGLRQSCRWNDMYYKLIEWKEAHDGDTTVPCDAKSSEEIKKMNRWVINQRTAYKYFMNGDKKHIKDHRIDALNKIGFCWSVTDQLWDANFEDLRKYYEQHGTFEVTHKQNRKLATFISRLRTAMSHKQNGLVQQDLTEEKISRLNSIKFSWGIKRKQRKDTTRDTVKFDVMYAHLVEFKKTYGHTKVNKMEKEWKKGQSVPEKRVYRRLPIFLAFCRKEQLLFSAGQPSALDEDKLRLLNELDVGWKKPANEPRKSTGGEASRKKKKRPGVEETAAKMEAAGYHYQPVDGDHDHDLLKVEGHDHLNMKEEDHNHLKVEGHDHLKVEGIHHGEGEEINGMVGMELPTIPPPVKPEQMTII